MPFLSIIAVLAALAVAGPRPAPTAAPTTPAVAAQRAYTYVGTVRAVAPERRTVSLITGVGFALRLVDIRVPQAAPITYAGAPVTLASIAPGAVIRAECRMMDATPVAERIEVVEQAP